MKELTEAQKQAIEEAARLLKYKEGTQLLGEEVGFRTGMKEVLTNPQEYGLMPIPSQKLPYRVGRKQGRAVLDRDGIEVVIFPIGKELDAIEYCNYLNRREINHEQ